MERMIAEMSQWRAERCGGTADAFTADDCKGGYFSVLPDYGLRVEGKTQQDGTPSPDNPVPIRCVKAGTKIHIRGKYSVGSTISTTWENRALNFDIVDFNKGTLANGGSQKFANLLLHDILSHGTIPFSAPQLLYYTEHGLPAGRYKFTFDHARYGSGTECDGTYMFTITQPIPAGGGFRHGNIGGWKSSYAKSDVIGNYLVTYNPVSTGGLAIETVAVAEYDGSIAIDLGTFTGSSRTYYTEDDKRLNSLLWYAIEHTLVFGDALLVAEHRVFDQILSVIESPPAISYVLYIV